MDDKDGVEGHGNIVYWRTAESPEPRHEGVHQGQEEEPYHGRQNIGDPEEDVADEDEDEAHSGKAQGNGQGHVNPYTGVVLGVLLERWLDS